MTWFTWRNPLRSGCPEPCDGYLRPAASTDARLHVVFGGAPISSFQRGELSDELARSYIPASITWLPADQGQERAVWNGTAIPKGPFRKTVDKLGAAMLNGYAGTAS